jgi:flagellar motor switch protein FliG
MSNQNNEKNGVYINGKNQVIELLRMTDRAHKTKLLQYLRQKNPALARELTESCISFESIWDLNDDGLKTILAQVQPTILGLALNLTQVKNQRRALSLVSKASAEKAFEILKKDLSANRIDCQKAQKKILELALELNRNRIIQFY